MERSTPHYGLMDVQAAVAVRGIDCFTRSAQEGAAAMGLAYVKFTLREDGSIVISFKEL